ncbi:Rrf2 family transcriptional regulator [bacterium]|nr:Rrf2 family transcriptional regulator [bacterium]MBU1674207.1 Rrf2 family transcriptional regulator [bacterium]
MLQITRQTEYAIRGLLELAERGNGTPIRLKTLAEACDVSEAFLAKIFQMLSQHNVVKSHRGVKGGFSLGRDKDKISLREIVEICEGGIALNHCLRKINTCDRTSECKVSKVWATAQASMTKALEETTLQDLI